MRQEGISSIRLMHSKSLGLCTVHHDIDVEVVVIFVVCSQDESSEGLIGEWMEQRGNRDQMVIATKASCASSLSDRRRPSTYSM